ncbi:hypothetical protein BRADI_3g32248v3 [Brachypodium distachyon]|uniref:Uncharacterized protein n=1 Tax=Brachypodium distachyon TaxID=15368 RepID=A0A2K2D0I0_BRADI|nr:hypothetical protein BRADI_3g32248v3 [Brachypodium distachyon]
MQRPYIRSSRCFPQEIFHHGEPQLCPDEGHIVVSCTPGMEVAEKNLASHALLATIRPGTQIPPPRITSNNLINAIVLHCHLSGGIRAKAMPRISAAAMIQDQTTTWLPCQPVVAMFLDCTNGPAM